LLHPWPSGSEPPNVELARRRDFNQASPDESSCERSARRSRPNDLFGFVALSVLKSYFAVDPVNARHLYLNLGAHTEGVARWKKFLECPTAARP
jgi:hypothetical protein